MAQVSLDDKRKHKEAGDFFMTGKTHFRNKDMHAAVASSLLTSDDTREAHSFLESDQLLT